MFSHTISKLVATLIQTPSYTYPSSTVYPFCTGINSWETTLRLYFSVTGPELEQIERSKMWIWGWL